MRPLRRLLACLVLLALVLALSATALADPGDPKRKLTKADQTRAKAMLLRSADFPSGFRATPRPAEVDDFYCRALDESDLTIRGEAESPEFESELQFVSSLAKVYATPANADVAWRRQASPAGQRCARDAFRDQTATLGSTFESFGKTSFPKLAQRSAAYRLAFTTQGVRVVVDIVVMQQARAQAAVIFGSGLAPMPKGERVRLARAVATRMARAMRGS
jgi:hypothetical protein